MKKQIGAHTVKHIRFYIRTDREIEKQIGTRKDTAIRFHIRTDRQIVWQTDR